jgi:3'-phosphoadenosine 5'-phosphosulfate sulfotransferase (PAPS reductase)/FAD synthetase
MMSDASSPIPGTEIRHILSLSGGKDSTALALYLRDKIPGIEYVFCDTGEELQETYDYLEKIEAHLGKRIHWLNPERPFQHYLDVYRGVLPDARTRWCTRMLKLKPFEKHVGDDPVCLYVGIRADESNRKGYISTKPNITTCFPFIEDGMRYKDIMRILKDSGLGLPDYYKWRSRSGCYFCFFQQRREWVGLLENHHELFKKASAFEKVDLETGNSFTWIQGESLQQLVAPKRVAEIKKEYQLRMARIKQNAVESDALLMEVFSNDNNTHGSCLICHL